MLDAIHALTMTWRALYFDLAFGLFEQAREIPRVAAEVGDAMNRASGKSASRGRLRHRFRWREGSRAPRTSRSPKFRLAAP